MTEARRTSARRRRRHLVRAIRNFFIGLLGPPLVRVWIGTLRVRFLGVDARDGRLPRHPRGIFVFWHQRILAFAGVFHHRGFRAVVSQHGDGEMIARICEGLGVEPIRGSTTRGGARALLEILKGAQSDELLAITPDGPRGPRHHLHEGAVYVASRTGLTLYPVAVSFARYWQLPTWDGFMIPRPFTRAVFRLGEAVRVPPGLDREGVEEFRRIAEERLRDLTRATDEGFEEMFAAAKRVRDLPPGPPR